MRAVNGAFLIQLKPEWSKLLLDFSWWVKIGNVLVEDRASSTKSTSTDSMSFNSSGNVTVLFSISIYYLLNKLCSNYIFLRITSTVVIAFLMSTVSLTKKLG